MELLLLLGLLTTAGCAVEKTSAAALTTVYAVAANCTCTKEIRKDMDEWVGKGNLCKKEGKVLIAGRIVSPCRTAVAMVLVQLPAEISTRYCCSPESNIALVKSKINEYCDKID